MRPSVKTFSVRVQRSLLSKETCLKQAEGILIQKRIEHMSPQAIAQEIYFHARVYFLCLFLERFHIRLTWFKQHADPIDLSDFGDTRFRQFCYRICWLIPGQNQDTRSEETNTES